MNLNEAAPDLDELAGDNVGAHVLRGYLAVVQPGGLPGELRTLIAVVLRLGVSAGEGEVAVLLQAPSHLRHGEGEVGQEEDLRIPEGVALVALAGEALGPDVHPVVMGGGHQLHMVLCEADDQLVKGGAVNGDGHPIPHLLRPAGGGLRSQGIESGGLILLQLRQGVLLHLGHGQARGLLVPGGVDVGEFLHHQSLACLHVKRELGVHPAAENVDVALGGLLRPVQIEPMGGVHHKGDVGLNGAGDELEVLLIVEAGLALGEVLGAVAGHPPVNAGLEGDGSILAGGHGDPDRDGVQPFQGDDALKAQLIPLALGRAPLHLALQQAGFQVQRPGVAVDGALGQVEPNSVQGQLNVGHIGGVGQLGDLLLGELVKGARHQQVTGLPQVLLLCGGAQAQIAVAQAEVGLHLAQGAGVEVGFYDLPLAFTAKI